MHANLNFSQHSEIPSYIVPESKKLKGLLAGRAAELVNTSVLCTARGVEKVLECNFLEDHFPQVARHIGLQLSTCLRQILHCTPKLCEASDRPIRILSLDGGGVKGISTICMLKHILQALNQCPNERSSPESGSESERKKLAQYFDLVVGTSAGGIIAMGLGSGMVLDDIQAFYNNSVREIFASRDSYWEQLQRGPGASAARRLEKIITTEWPERTPASSSASSTSFSIPFEMQQEEDASDLGSLPGVCMLTTLVSREPSRTCMLKTYLSDQDLSIPYLPAVHRASILQCIRATSAAPYYLEEMLCHSDVCTGEFLTSDEDAGASGQKPPSEPFHLEPVLASYRFVDGAISVNNPTCAAILEARTLYPNRPIVVVSLGTGNGLARVPIKTYPSGIGVVLQNLITSTADVALYDSLAEQMLAEGDTYFRFCPTGDVFNCDMGTNDKDIIDAIREEATTYMQSPLVQRKLKALAELIKELEGAAAVE